MKTTRLKLRWIALVLIMFPAISPAAGARTLVVVGDSLSAAFGIPDERGWVNLLKNRLLESGSEWKVVNASISGDTTAGGRSRLPRLLELHAPQLVLIELGSNDGLRGFGFEQIRRNLDAMIQLSRESGAEVLLVGGRLPPNYGAAYAEAFHGLFHQVAQHWDVPLVPFLLKDVALDPALMQDDGYHPNAAAQPRLLENVWGELEALLNAPPKSR